MVRVFPIDIEHLGFAIFSKISEVSDIFVIFDVYIYVCNLCIIYIYIYIQGGSKKSKLLYRDSHVHTVSSVPPAS